MGTYTIDSNIVPYLQHLLLVQQLCSSVSESGRVQVTNDRGVGVYRHTTIVALVQHSLVLFAKR